jgi:cysteine desulfurase
VRFTFGRYNTVEEADGVIEAIAEVVGELRAISPLMPDNRGT